MSNADWALLQALTDQSFANGAFRQNLRPAFNAVGAAGLDAAAYAELALAYANAAAASYALALALTGGGQGIGTTMLALPRVVEHGSAAFAEIDAIRGLFPNQQNASYQIVLQDFGKLVFCTSGTNTYTFPAAVDLPDGWFCRLRNRSSVNLTLNPTGADTLNGSASLAIATGSAILTAVRTAAGTFEVA